MEPSPATASPCCHHYLQVRAARSTGACSRGTAGPTCLFFGVQREILFGSFRVSDAIHRVPTPSVQNRQLGSANYTSCSSYCPDYSVRVFTDLQLAKVMQPRLSRCPCGHRAPKSSQVTQKH